MEKTIHYAIVSVPFQQWGETYGEAQAFSRGTIFPELDKPFFITETEDAAVQECSCGYEDKDSVYAKLKQIQQAAFTVDDLKLYMDTHPDDQQALQLFKNVLKRKKSLMEEFAREHYPLTVACMAEIYAQNPDSSCYCWKEGPIPWEGVCK